MGVFKITTADNQALIGGANRAEGLEKLRRLDQKASRDVLTGLRANLVGANGTPKHGVLKLRNSSSSTGEMEFARMRGMDRLFSKKGTFENTAKALRILMEKSGMKPETAEALIKQYSAKDGSIKYKDAVILINRVLPETSSGASVREALQNAGITDVPAEALADKIKLKEDDLSAGSFGVVFEINDHGTTCMLKRNEVPVEIQLSAEGQLVRGKFMDGNQLAAGKVPGVITPNRYLVSKTDSLGSKSYHVVTAGRHFKQFCKESKTEDASLKMEGLIMEKAKGTRMFEARSNATNQKEMAKGFTAILMNASAHGVVFGDIKEENAFVDGGKVTLIDTDAAFKHSKASAKNPSQPIVPHSYAHPKGTDGQQQDLYSVGLTLLEHAYRSRGGEESLGKADELAEIGMLRGKMRYMTLLMNKGKEAAYIGERIDRLVGTPRRGSVEEFAVLCIKTALQKESDYNQRFTGAEGGQHLLDPILNHELLGGRDAFIAKHFIGNSASPNVIPQAATEESTQIIQQEVLRRDSIEDNELMAQTAADDMYTRMQDRMDRMKNRESSDSELSDKGDDNQIFRNFLFNQIMSSEMKKLNRDSDT